MKREHAKIAAPLLAAYAEGKTIQFYASSIDEWIAWDMSEPFNLGIIEYRIKPDPETVLMTIEDFPVGVIWLKTESTVEIVTIFHDDGKLETDKKISLIGDFHSNGVLWSTDRKNWKPLTKEVS